jgi:probable O-glycosylation ligase (exosortase A-associated)
MLRMIAVLAVFAGGAFLGLRSAVWASCLFTWNDIFRPVEWARRYGILGSPRFLPVHFCTAVLAFAIFFRKWEHRWNRMSIALLIFIGWIFTCALFARNVDIALDKAIEAAKYLIPLIFISASLTDRWAQQLFLATLAGSVGVWMAHHGLDAILKGGQPEIRRASPGGQMTDRNDFMVAGTACIPLIAYLGWFYTGRWERWVRVGSRVALAFCIAALFLSLSRGAMLGFGALVLWYLLATGRVGKRAIIALPALLAIVLFTPEAVWNRLSTLDTDSGFNVEGSMRNRMEHMRTALKVTRDRPVFGAGPDNFPIVSLDYSEFEAEPHSIWLMCSAEYGLPMLAFFVLLIVSLLRQLHAVAKEARAARDRQTEGLALCLSCAVVGFLASGSFTSQFLSQYLWSIFALAGAFLVTPRPQLAIAPARAPARARVGTTVDGAGAPR